MAPVMIIGSVPLYNVMAVIVLSFFKPGQNGIDRAVLKKTFKGIYEKITSDKNKIEEIIAEQNQKHSRR